MTTTQGEERGLLSSSTSQVSGHSALYFELSIVSNLAQAALVTACSLEPEEKCLVN